jgi:hypothetical protein
LPLLVKVAGLEEAFGRHAGEDVVFKENWNFLQSWSEQSRYRMHRPEDARALLVAVSDRSHGVITWIKQQW